MDWIHNLGGKGHNEYADTGILALGRDRVSLFDVDRSPPYSGEAPPRPPSGDVSQFIRNKRGVWCKLDSLSRMIPVYELGERWQKGSWREMDSSHASIFPHSGVLGQFNIPGEEKMVAGARRGSRA